MRPTVKRAMVGLLFCGTITVGLRAYFGGDDEGDPVVATSPVTRGSIVDGVSATGTLQSVTMVQVGVQVSGIVSWLGADFNSVVHKGQVIAKIDPSLLESQVAQARAAMAKTTADAENRRAQAAAAQQQFDRANQLYTRGIIARDNFESVELALKLAQSQVNSADAQIIQTRAALSQADLALDHAVVLSPIDGIVIQRSVDVGQTVSASVSAPTLFEIAADLTAMQVNAKIDESDVGRIRPAQPVSFQVDTYPGRSFAGKVLQVRLDPTLLQNVTTYSVIIDAPNRDMALRPGMTANVTIQIAERDDAVRIANGAVRFRPTQEMFAFLGQSPENLKPLSTAAGAGEGEEGEEEEGVTPVAATTIDALFAPLPAVETSGRVWVYADKRLQPVQVRLGISDGQNTELLAGGLEPGMELVSSFMIPGANVRPPAVPTGGLFMSTPGGGGRTGPGR